MKNLSVIVLIFSVYLLSGFNNVFASPQRVVVGPYTVDYDSGPIYYEDGSSNFSWSVSGSLDTGMDIEHSIVSTKAGVAVFNNGSTSTSSNWNGSARIVPRSEGKFTFRIRVWKDGMVRYSKDISMEVKYRTVYALEGSDNIIAGVKTNYNITPDINIQSVNWSVSNSSVKTSASMSSRIVLGATSSGSVTLTGEILLKTGDKKTVKKTITIQDAVLNIEGNGGVVKSILGTPEVKYQLSGVPSGAKITWQTDNSGARIISGQGTGTVKLDVDDISQFKLTVTAEYGSIKKTLTKDIKVVEFLLDNFDLIFHPTNPIIYYLFFDIKFKDKLTGDDLIGKAEWYINFYSIIHSFDRLVFYVPTNSNEILFNRINSNEISPTRIYPVSPYQRIAFWYQYGQNTKLPAAISHEWIHPRFSKNNYLKMKVDITLNNGSILTHDFILFDRYDRNNPYPMLVSNVNEVPELRNSFSLEETENITSFDNSSESDIVVYNLQGQLVYSQKKVINFDIYNAPLQTGVYIIKKTDSHGKVETKKVRKN